MTLTPLQRTYLAVLDTQPKRWFTSADAAHDFIRAQQVEKRSHLTREEQAVVLFWTALLIKEAPRARRVLHRLADRGLCNRSQVGAPPGIGDWRFRMNAAGRKALT